MNSVANSGQPARSTLRWRHEWKYWIRWETHQRLRARLRTALHADPNAGPNGDYHIRSLYFDTLGGDGSFEKLAGVDDRGRFRIRIYNKSDQVVRLEAKHRKGFRIAKESTLIDRNEVLQLVRRRKGANPNAHPLLNKLRLAVGRGLLKPAVVVDYEREAWIHPLGNVRITFDKHLSSGTWNHDLFDPRLPMRPIRGPSDLIIEVKYDGFLPTFVRRLLPHELRAPLSISKYTLCRPRLHSWENG